MVIFNSRPLPKGVQIRVQSGLLALYIFYLPDPYGKTKVSELGEGVRPSELNRAMYLSM